jgi:hypothetical protein
MGRKGHTFATQHAKFTGTRNDGDLGIMPHEDDCLDTSAGFAGSPGYYENHEGEIRKCERCRCRSSPIWPPDPLTRLMMQADHVSEIALDALLQRVARARAAAIGPQTGCARADE